MSRFSELGYQQDEINQRLEDIVHRMFYGSPEEKIYYEAGEDMAYVMDTGNHDVRTEGMSYAMMIFVQLNKQKEFDKIWKWARTYMYMESGENAGYFAWSVDPSGKKNSYGPAPDGEEFFAMALFFAAHRFGNGEGIFNYTKEARELLSTCVHKGEDGIGSPMWEPRNYLIKFVPNMDFSDPSYHVPHFYELFAKWVSEEEQDFWKKATKASREYLVKSCHPITGLAPEYATYEGEPKYYQNHHLFYSDSYRVAANIGLDALWFGKKEDLVNCNERLQKFFMETVKGYEDYVYEIDGTRIEEKVLHPVGLIATNAMASLATNGEYSDQCIRLFWETPLRTGERRYYDNFLYLFAFLALSGNYQIWE